MAGRPKRRALVQELTKRAQEDFDDGTKHLEYVLQWIEDGKTMSELARDISEASQEDVFGSFITRYLTSTFPDYTTRVTAARKIGAHAMVDDARDIIDNLEDFTPDKDRTAVAKARAEVRQWTAERYNRAELGTPKDSVSVNVSISTLHIDALRTRATARIAGTESSAEGTGVDGAHARSLSDGADLPALESEYEIIEQADSAIESAITVEHDQLNLL